MSSTTPSGVRQARIQAKHLLADLTEGNDPARRAAAKRMLALPYFASFTPDDVLRQADGVKLKQAREVIAREWGADSWTALVAALKAERFRYAPRGPFRVALEDKEPDATLADLEDHFYGGERSFRGLLQGGHNKARDAEVERAYHAARYTWGEEVTVRELLAGAVEDDYIIDLAIEIPECWKALAYSTFPEDGYGIRRASGEVSPASPHPYLFDSRVVGQAQEDGSALDAHLSSGAMNYWASFTLFRDEEVVFESEPIHSLADVIDVPTEGHLYRIHIDWTPSYDSDLKQAVEDVRGLYASLEGHTDDDVQRALSTLSRWTGLDLACVWDYYDAIGFGGNSEHAVTKKTDEGTEFYEVPSLIWRFLWEEDGDDPVDLYRLAALTFDDVGGAIAPTGEGRTPVRGAAYNFYWTDRRDAIDDRDATVADAGNPDLPGIVVEWDPDFHPSLDEWHQTGGMAFVPLHLIAYFDEDLERAFEEVTGADPVHIIHYSYDAIENVHGDLISRVDDALWQRKLAELEAERGPYSGTLSVEAANGRELAEFTNRIAEAGGEMVDVESTNGGFRLTCHIVRTEAVRLRLTGDVTGPDWID